MLKHICKITRTVSKDGESLGYWKVAFDRCGLWGCESMVSVINNDASCETWSTLIALAKNVLSCLMVCYFISFYFCNNSYVRAHILFEKCVIVYIAPCANTTVSRYCCIRAVWLPLSWPRLTSPPLGLVLVNPVSVLFCSIQLYSTVYNSNCSSLICSSLFSSALVFFSAASIYR